MEKYNSTRDLSEIVKSDKKSPSGDAAPGATNPADSGVPTGQLSVPGQASEIELPDEVAEEEEVSGPSDASSLRLMENFATAIGAKAHHGIRNVRAKGTFAYSKDLKAFELVETSQGERVLTVQWRYLGRVYRDRSLSIPSADPDEAEAIVSRVISKNVIARNGEESWERVYFEVFRGGKLLHRYQFGDTSVSEGRTLPAKLLSNTDRAVIAGGYGEVSPGHFQKVFLLLQPILQRGGREIGFAYLGQEKLLQRPMYLVRYGAKQFFYFDAEKFLLVQWSGQSQLAGQSLDVAYRSTAFRQWSSLLFPSRVELVAEGEVLGNYTIEGIEVNAQVAADFFELPEF